MLRQLSTVGKNPIKSIVIKATYKDDQPPKEKHIRRLIGLTSEEPSVVDRFHADNLVSELVERSQSTSWEVVLKCLIVIHRLLRDAHPSFAEQLNHSHGLLNKSAFLDQSTTYSWGQSKYIHSYCKYLAEKVYNTNKIGYAVERRVTEEGADFVKRFRHRDLADVVPYMQKQFQYLLECNIDTSEGIHPIPTNSFIQLIKDGFRIHSVLSICIYNILSSFRECSVDQARWCLDVYRKFVIQNDKFEKWSKNAVSLNLVKSNLLPEFNNFPASLIRSLEEYVEQLENSNEQIPHVHDLKDILDESDLQLVVEHKEEQKRKTNKDKSTKKSRNTKRKKKTKSKQRSHSPDNARPLKSSSPPRISPQKIQLKHKQSPKFSLGEPQEDLLDLPLELGHQSDNFKLNRELEPDDLAELFDFSSSGPSQPQPYYQDAVEVSEVPFGFDAQEELHPPAASDAHNKYDVIGYGAKTSLNGGVAKPKTRTKHQKQSEHFDDLLNFNAL